MARRRRRRGHARRPRRAARGALLRPRAAGRDPDARGDTGGAHGRGDVGTRSPRRDGCRSSGRPPAGRTRSSRRATSPRRTPRPSSSATASTTGCGASGTCARAASWPTRASGAATPGWPAPGLVFCHTVGVDHVAAALDLVRAFPDVVLCVDQSGMPESRDAGLPARRGARRCRTLAAEPHVVCKISSLGVHDHDWTVEGRRPWVRALARGLRTRPVPVRLQLAGRAALQRLRRRAGRLPGRDRRPHRRRAGGRARGERPPRVPARRRAARRAPPTPCGDGAGPDPDAEPDPAGPTPRGAHDEGSRPARDGPVR